MGVGIVYLGGMTLTNLIIHINPNFPPFGGILTTVEFLFIAYAIALPMDKIGIIKPTKLAEFYLSFLT